MDGQPSYLPVRRCRTPSCLSVKLHWFAGWHNEARVVRVANIASFSDFDNLTGDILVQDLRPLAAEGGDDT